MNSKMTLSARALFFTLIVLSGLYQYTAEPTIRAKVEPIQQVAGQPIRYVDSTDADGRRHWEFGNGQDSRVAKGEFYYSQPGTYLIRLTIDNNLTKTFSVVVTPRKIVQTQDSLVKIKGPATGYEREKLVFTAEGGGARQFSWRFGASGQIDSRDQTAIYSYPAVDSYTPFQVYKIELMTDVTKYPVVKEVRIFKGFNKFAPTIDSLDITGSDFKRRLQLIADGQSFNVHYNYLLKRYLCEKNSTIVRINDAKTNDFYSYCMGLQFDRGVRIDGVAVIADSLTSCLVRLNVTQHNQ
ncbi:PKD domain-containing protein [Spirosoma linguale]|uniref:PKD domain containing protein n=1 Tax=Spirosoma linguale (strain ATCC 33905 / DSM 74 / LMG 10896 / Claus 1) TaxID=504472 RepID=D2QJP3_SPILD|nr:PKD domain containing protein [Spirosoma linguale DSM 74]